MYPIPSYFTDFLKKISLTNNQREECITSHKELREKLMQDENLKGDIKETFLQGSYVRHTINRPVGDKLPDVDLIVVTRLSEEKYTPYEALEHFRPFLEQHYKGKYQMQGRSWGIVKENVGLDMVITSAPSEIFNEMYAEYEAFNKQVESKPLLTDFIENLLKSMKGPEWKKNPLRIPDREVNKWEDTHPLEQIKWTIGKNGLCNGHFNHVVRTIKWWRELNQTRYKYPKGYPLEHIVGYCCPDGITSVAEGVTLSFENIVSRFEGERAQLKTPFLPDHGTPERNVLSRINGNEFAAFYDNVAEASVIARGALDAETPQQAIDKWRILLGEKFPTYAHEDRDFPDNGTKHIKGGYTGRSKPSEEVPGGRFA